MGKHMRLWGHLLWFWVRLVVRGYHVANGALGKLDAFDTGYAISTIPHSHLALGATCVWARPHPSNIVRWHTFTQPGPNEPRLLCQTKFARACC